MKSLRVVIDTNVLISALRSRRGASFKLLEQIDHERLEIYLSVSLFLEYESVAKRLIEEIGLCETDIDTILDYIAAVTNHQTVYYLWRPILRDPKDDMVLELAATASCDAIVTFNKKDFDGARKFRIRLLTPREILEEIGELP